MKYFLFVFAIVIISCSSYINDDIPIVESSDIQAIKSEINDSFPIDTIVSELYFDSTAVSSVQPTSNLYVEKQIPVLTRYTEFPGNKNFNGKPMTNQVEIPNEVLQFNEDTLSQIAITSYKSYTGFFPVSIADDFENSISTEIILYPELIFRFEVFEDQFASKPYLIKEIVVLKDSNGDIISK